MQAIGLDSVLCLSAVIIAWLNDTFGHGEMQFPISSLFLGRNSRRKFREYTRKLQWYGGHKAKSVWSELRIDTQLPKLGFKQSCFTYRFICTSRFSVGALRLSIGPLLFGLGTNCFR